MEEQEAKSYTLYHKITQFYGGGTAPVLLSYCKNIQTFPEFSEPPTHK